MHRTEVHHTGERVKSREVLGPAVVVGAFYAILLIGLLGVGHHDPRDFIEIGLPYIERSQVSPVIRVDPSYHGYLRGDGYDGQFSYFIALDPLNAQGYTDQPIYRYERILYPLLARLLAAGQAPLIPAALIAINWLALTGGTLAVAARLRSAGTSGWAAIVFGLAPGMYFALRRDLADGLAYSLVALAVYLFYRGGRPHLLWSAIAFSLAVFCRETTAVFPVIFALMSARSPAAGEEGRGGGSGIPLAAAFVAIAIGPWLLYRIALSLLLEHRGATSPFEPFPFLGLAYYWPWSRGVLAEVVSIVLPALIVAAVSGFALWRRQLSAEILALLLNVLLFVVFLNHASYVELAASARISLGVVLATVLALPTLQRLTGGRRLWFVTAAVLWLAPLPLVIVAPIGRALGIT